MRNEIVTIKKTGEDKLDLKLIQGTGTKGTMIYLNQSLPGHNITVISLTRTDAMALVVELREWINNTVE